MFLHLGFHKTGSSSLQELLRANRPLLPADYHCLVQRDRELEAIASACKAYDRRPTPRRRAKIVSAWHGLVTWFMAAPCSTLVISNEDFLGRIPSPRDDTELYEHSPDILSALLDASGGLEVVPCLYVRSGESWRKSLYKHLLKTRGIRKSYPAFADVSKFRSPDLEAVVSRVQERTSGRVMTFSFEEDLGTRLGPGTAFLEHCGLGADQLARWQPVGRRNEGISDFVVERMSTPGMLWLPRHVRKHLVGSLLAKGR